MIVRRDTPCLFPKGQSVEGMVSVTQMQQYMSCPHRWSLGYVEGLRPKVEREYLTIGKLCHAGFEATMRAKWGSDRDRVRRTVSELASVGESEIRSRFNEYMGRVQFLDEEVPAQDALLHDAVDVFSQAIAEFDPNRWRVYTVYRGGVPEPALEVHFLIPGCKLHGYVDAVLTDLRDGGTWCTDYKFRSQLSPDDDEQYNLQNAVYSVACDCMGIETAGTMTWQHLNVPASDPKVNKDGSVSRSRIRTTWDRYARAVVESGGDVRDYLDMKEKISSVKWFQETKEIRSRHAVDKIWRGCVVPVTESIRKSRESASTGARYLDPWNCKRCQFQSLCQAELRGYDVDDVIAREYTRRDRQ